MFFAALFAAYFIRNVTNGQAQETGNVGGLLNIPFAINTSPGRQLVRVPMGVFAASGAR
jgi:hypothetical protein